MYELALNMPVNLPLWLAALDGHADWEAIYKGYASAVDWPTAGFFRELNAIYPEAKFILTVRDAQSWAESFSETIYKLHAGGDQAPAELKPFFDMANGVVFKTGFPFGLDVPGLAKAFNVHRDAVRVAIPADRLLTYEVKDGWAPLCKYLGVPEPAEVFPRTSSRAEFWEAVAAKMAEAGF